MPAAMPLLVLLLLVLVRVLVLVIVEEDMQEVLLERAAMVALSFPQGTHDGPLQGHLHGLLLMPAVLILVMVEEDIQ